MRSLFWWFAVPTLMVSVAGLQHVLANQRLLTPWKGGGFGMFSTIDSISSRHLRVFLHTESGKMHVSLPKTFPRRLRQKLRAFPTRSDLQHAAQGLIAMTWVKRGGRKMEALRFGQQLPAQGKRIHVLAIDVEVWLTEFEGRTAKIRNRKLIGYNLRNKH